MAIVSKTNRDGVDIVIENLQQRFYAQLLGYWDAATTYQCYPRANKNYRSENIIPEVSLDEREYSEVLASDKFSVTSFFLNNNDRVFQDEFKRIKQSISIIFQADLVALYGLSERADEKFNMDVLRVLKKENFYIYGDIDMIEGVDNVYSDLSLSGELKERVNVTDISKQHVLRVNFDVIYKPDCNSTLPPVCAGVSVLVDGVFSEVVAAGGVYNCVTGGSASIDIAVNGTPFYTGVSTNQDLPVKDSIGSNNVGSQVGAEWRIGDTQVILKNTANETLSTQNFYAESQANEMVADNVTSDFNGVTILQETPSGQNKSFSVVDSNSDPIGSVNSDLPNSTQILVSDVTQTVNGVAITNNKAQTSKAITIRYANNDPVTVTTITDTETVFIGEVPDVVTPLNTSNLYKTGQTTSYVANDDGDLERGNGASFLTLSHNNYFGNTNRFTDTLGGQAYANNWVIDWTTWNQVTGDVNFWYRVPQTPALWATVLAGQPYTVGAYNDCMIPNIVELRSLYLFEGSQALNYAPFNISVSGSSQNLWSTTTTPNATTTALTFNGVTIEQARAKASVACSYILIRYGNISEL